jgi:predicted cupin superfamily sugar epimerase
MCLCELSIIYFHVHNENMKHWHKVERAIRIWAEGIYDANTGKIATKINPLSNKPSKETAFSSTIWADATNKYVAKIATLKDDVWKELMDEASSYVAFTWENFTAGNSLAALDPHATDRDRALFSDEE